MTRSSIEAAPNPLPPITWLRAAFAVWFEASVVTY
jgi:hypothetical protein